MLKFCVSYVTKLVCTIQSLGYNVRSGEGCTTSKLMHNIQTYHSKYLNLDKNMNDKIS